MAAQDLRRRFDRLVDRADEHHRWIGATRPDTGVGRIKVGGRHRAAHEGRTTRRPPRRGSLAVALWTA
jgi:hypothetical protein